MKVLWLSPSPSLAESYLKDKPVSTGWIKSLEKNIQDKVDLTIVCYDDGEPQVFEYGHTTYYTVKRFTGGKIGKVLRRAMNRLEPQSDIDRFVEIINEVKPDVIHAFGGEGPYGLVQKYTDIPVIVSLQGLIAFLTYRFFLGISFFDLLRYSKLKDWLLFRTYINVYYEYVATAKREKEVYKHIRYLGGRTEYDKQVLSKVYAPHAKYFHYDDILRDSFYTTKWDNDLKDCINLFTTNGDVTFKGIEDILYCGGILDELGVNYQWQVAGLGEKDEAARIARRAVGKMCGKNVHFVGRLSEQALIDGLLNTHIYVCASHIDVTPNSLCEALILGVPSISTKVGGTMTLLKDREEGIIIQDSDPFSMAAYIIEMTEDYAKAKEMGKNARERALKRHNAEKITNDLLAIYEEMKANPNPEPTKWKFINQAKQS